MLRRTAFKDSLRLTLEYSVEDVLARTIAFADLPAEAQLAWSEAERRKKEKKDKKGAKKGEAPIDPRHMAAEPAPPSAPLETGAPDWQVGLQCKDDGFDEIDTTEDEGPQLRLSL